MIAAQTLPSETEVLSRLRDYLTHHPIPGIRLEAVTEGVRRDDNWYYVPILLKEGEPAAYQFYDLLIEIEEQFRKQEHLNVLLVPAN